MLSGSGPTTAEICRQLGVGRSTLYRHLHASGWEREAPGRTAASEAMMKALMSQPLAADHADTSPTRPTLQQSRLNGNRNTPWVSGQAVRKGGASSLSILDDPGWAARLSPDDLRGLSPLICTHINPYGRIDFERKAA